MAQKLNSQQCQMAQTAQKTNFKKTYSMAKLIIDVEVYAFFGV
jgi:hypothetical protein